MTDNEKLKFMELENQLKYSRCKIVEQKEEIQRLKLLLDGVDVIKNSIPVRHECNKAFDRLRNSQVNNQ
jgi:hypothetical protein